MDAYLRSIPGSQAKKPSADLSKVTHKVFFDIEIDGKPAGSLISRSGRCTIFRGEQYRTLLYTPIILLILVLA
jgi:peptidylprolyl isomerase